jgi:hypothetical protein
MTDSTLNPLTLKLPEGYRFSDLKLRRDAQAIDLDMDIVRVVCQLNALDFDKVCANPGPVVSTLLSVWYKSHLAQGGAPDAVMETFRQEGQLH